MSTGSKPLKIVLIGPSWPFKGGIAPYTTSLYRQLAKRHEVLFISFRRQYPDWLYPGKGDRDPSDLELKEPASQRLIDSLSPWSWYKTVRRIRDFNPDLVIYSWWVMYWAPQFILMIHYQRRLLKNTRVLFICHNVVAHEPGRMSRFLTRQTLRLGDAFLVHSEKDRSDLRAMLPGVPVAMAEHPSYELPPEQLVDRRAARDALQLEGDVLLFFGFVRPYKGLDVLLDAMALVLPRHPCTLVVAGEIWGDRKSYDRQVERLGIADHVRLTGDYIPRDRVATYFGACDLVVLPYRSATGSAVVKLAYSHQRPVIVTNTGSLAAAVIEGETGSIVEPENAEQMAAAIVAFLERPDRADMARRAAAHDRQFSWRNLLEALDSIAGPPPA